MLQDNQNQNQNSSNNASMPFTDNSDREKLSEDEDNLVKLNPDTNLTYNYSGKVNSIRNPTNNLNNKKRKDGEEVYSFTQLTKIERIKVEVAYREAVLKMFTVIQIPQYIRIKTGIPIAQSFVKKLHQNQMKDDKRWYYHLARDSMAYVGAYRQAIDEIDQYKKELWLLTVNDKVPYPVKVQCYMEMHRLTKTSIILLRDLPFIANLSRFYDIDKMFGNDESGNNTTDNNNTGGGGGFKFRDTDYFNPMRKLTKEKRYASGLYLDEFDNERGKDGILIPSGQNNDKIGSDENILYSKDQFDDINTSIVKTILDKTRSKKIFHKSQQEQETDPEKKVTDEMQEDMKKQMAYLGIETNEEAKQVSEDVRKLKENIMINAKLESLEKEIEQIGGIEAIENPDERKKVQEIVEKYQRSLSFVEQFLTPEQRESIKSARKLTES